MYKSKTVSCKASSTMGWPNPAIYKRKFEFKNTMTPKKRLCLRCGGVLKAIGNQRKNGAAHADWKYRKYHKKCWKLLAPW